MIPIAQMVSDIASDIMQVGSSNDVEMSSTNLASLQYSRAGCHHRQ